MKVAFFGEPVQVIEDPVSGDFPDIGTYINPFTDFGFKRLFGQELSSDILIDFLNEVLSNREATITEIIYLNNEQQPEQKDQRRAAFDLHCRTSSGARIIVEMQAGYQRHIVERALFYAARAISEQAPRGEWNYRYDRIYTIVIMDFTLPDAFGSAEVRHEGLLIDTVTGQPMTDRLVLIFLEMRNFTKREDELETHMDKWLFLLRNLGQLTSRPKALQERIFKKIFTIAKISAMDTKEYTAYQQSLKAYWDLTSSIQSSFELGVEKGLEKGIKQGIIKGMEQGLEKGRDEGIQIGVVQAKTDLIIKLHKSGMSAQEIANLTELSESEIQRLINPQ
jgi:predicted transposase/invertase (TIGR01784 family)